MPLAHESIPALLAMVLAAPALADSDANLVWHDEFDGNALDLKKWEYRQLGPRKGGVNVKEAVTLDGQGHLHLTTTKVGEKFHTGMIGTQGLFERAFGYFECRVKLQRQIGHWSAFWLQSPLLGKVVGDTKQSGTEIDIFEYLRKRGDKVQHTLHWDGYGKDHKSQGHVPDVPGLGEGWHTVGLEWTKDRYVFTVDGKETWRTDKGVSHAPEYIILSLEVGPWAGDIKQAKLPDSVEFDYVRVYDQRPPAPNPASRTGALKK
ncbi:MAG TPA: glycoside hydrolase family 16 protein [Phycisphaerae bacterium]|nr:glycoside hydrolase family 16 protein [Phycisphaerae bacterium]